MKEAKNYKEAIDIWGGIEYTINRVGDKYYEQLRKGGHFSRIEDLDLIADLGIKTLRYPVLWEQIAPNGISNANWDWTDERLFRLKELGITPIAGLLHHGSGPKYTSLLDPDFSIKLGEFAYYVAERYPWLKYFTPVNEPLTTARFSGLYGFWYPHGKDDNTFASTFINQCKGIIEAMRSIKTIIPDAQLIQTEDLGKTHSTKKLSYQADFENDRRWATFDFLSGNIDYSAPFIKYLIKIAGIPIKTIAYFKENICIPDILGINHYITSERFLDDQVNKYPTSYIGGNRKNIYVDTEVVRVAPDLRKGHYNLLKEAHLRYNLPIAVTELHLGCTREEQLRWFKEAWEAANMLKQEGADIKAVTAWSLLGAHDWNSLLVKDRNFYEQGVFDVRNDIPRPTALAQFIKSLTKNGSADHPVLHAPGWWKRQESILYPLNSKYTKKNSCAVGFKLKERPFENDIPSIIITGATGTLGKAFARICDHRAIQFILLNRNDLDIADPISVDNAIKKYKPWAVINSAGFVKVDEAESMQQICFRENTEGPVNLANSCRKYGVRFVTFSSDLIFDGMRKSLYMERHAPSPLNIYGHSKLESEKRVLKTAPDSLIIRTSSFFGPWDDQNFLTRMVNTLKNNSIYKTSESHIISPTYIPDLVNACLDLLIDNESGIWHMTNPSEISSADLAYMTAEMAQLDTGLIKICDTKELGFVASRPLYSALGSERGVLLPTLEDAVNRYLTEVHYNINTY